MTMVSIKVLNLSNRKEPLSEKDELRLKVARTLFEHEWSKSEAIPEDEWKANQSYWLEAADRVLAVPEIADGLALTELKREEITR